MSFSNYTELLPRPFPSLFRHPCVASAEKP